MTTNDMQTALFAEILKRQPNLSCDFLVTPAVLTDIGIDSLTIVDLILTFAERSGADLETALDGLEPPNTLGELLAILDRFMETA